MKLALLSISMIALFADPFAFAYEVEASVGVYYFTSNQEKLDAAHLEIAEGAQTFSVDRDPRAVARDLAREELARGNVCLKQAEGDLRKALRSKMIGKMCREIFRDEIAAAMASVRKKKWKADAIRCEASLETRETPGAMRVVLSFRSRLMMSERLPEKLVKAGFAEEPKSWILPLRESAMGESQGGWKEILKNRSCSLDEDTLQDHLDRFLEEAKEARVLARCWQRLDLQVERLSRLQAQFSQYVPGEWLEDVGGESATGLLLRPLPGSSSSMNIKACREAREVAGERLEKLNDISESIASKHDLPALLPGNLPGGRELASEEQD